MAGITIIKKAQASTGTKFSWQASESSPVHYPMQIIAGSFHSPDGSSLYIPSGGTLHNGWGRAVSSHVVGEDLKSLPDRLSLSFFSYAEDQFYSGDFKLPYDKIVQLFQQGHFSPKKNEHITFDEIVAGITPGGGVSIWLVSLDKAVEVFFAYADKDKLDWAVINDNPNITREEYIRLNLQETLEAEQLRPEDIVNIKNNPIPFGLWKRYHTHRYAWQIQFTRMDLLNKRVSYIKYFNGERDFIDIPDKLMNKQTTRAVPSEMNFVWTRPPEKPMLIELFFNEQEIFAAFEKLGSNNQALQFEMRIDNKDNKSQLSIELKNENDSILIKQTEIKTYGIPERQE